MATMTVQAAVAECKRLHGFNRMGANMDAWVKAAREEGIHVDTDGKDAYEIESQIGDAVESRCQSVVYEAAKQWGCTQVEAQARIQREW